MKKLKYFFIFFLLSFIYKANPQDFNLQNIDEKFVNNSNSILPSNPPAAPSEIMFELKETNVRIPLKETNVRIPLIYIKAGTFVMGRESSSFEKLLACIFPSQKKYCNEKPSRKIKITKDFYIGENKITNEQYCNFLNEIDNSQKYIELNDFTNIDFKNEIYVPKTGCEKGPVNTVPWIGAKAFCDWLSFKTGHFVRLPSEAEWEFVACGSDNRLFPWGNVEKHELRQKNACIAVGTISENVTPDGVVEMLGHIGEWCSDFYGERYLKDDLVDPKGPSGKDLENQSLNFFYPNKYYVLRGRSNDNKGRDFGLEVNHASVYGFRILVELE